MLPKHRDLVLLSTSSLLNRNLRFRLHRGHPRRTTSSNGCLIENWTALDRGRRRGDSSTLMYLLGLQSGTLLSLTRCSTTTRRGYGLGYSLQKRIESLITWLLSLSLLWLVRLIVLLHLLIIEVGLRNLGRRSIRRKGQL